MNQVIFPDISLVKKVFNWKPKVTFKVGLKKQLNFIEMFKYYLQSTNRLKDIRRNKTLKFYLKCY